MHYRYSELFYLRNLPLIARSSPVMTSVTSLSWPKAPFAIFLPILYLPATIRWAGGRLLVVWARLRNLLTAASLAQLTLGEERRTWLSSWLRAMVESSEEMERRKSALLISGREQEKTDVNRRVFLDVF